ncbi:MAG: peptidase M13 [Alphaproteobacteria bacterium]|nr:peptidase M13 [Alphaproteobacteria bacterium]MBU1526491.1 peptidase M13 [Alphaproteobacteria bacterium]MBU2116463.1 peptidase M13 [Alphaproteobacteria bacterium]MBU2350291.1 peptidase M13 [Alphaproteobacteria bacterium]MBU2381271.1 peptidase M13 [Alphaproteobacteria bacterium]
MRKSLLLTVAASAALLAGTPALAQQRHTIDDGHGHDCVDEACTVFTLFNPALFEGGSWEGTEAPKYGTWGFAVEGRDLSVAPGENFFLHANGAALKTLEIPSDRTSYGSFALLRELSDNRLRALLDELLANPNLAAGTDERKMADLYRAYMDVERIEALDARPAEPYLAAIRAADDHGKMAAYMGTLQGGFGSGFFGVGIGDDQKDPSRYTTYVSQSGIGLPNRDYYLDAARFGAKKALYEVYVADMLGMIGWENPQEAAAAIVALETRIAEAHWTPEQNRNRDMTYNPFTPTDLAAYAPGFDWAAWLEQANLGGVTTVVVRQNTALPKIAQVYADTPIEVIQAWQAFHTIDDMAPFLSARFSDRQWQFRSRDLAGQPEQRSREKRAVSFAEGTMGEAFGRMYVDRWFPAQSKMMMEELVANLRLALADRIRQLDWMGDATKEQALYKLDNFTVKVGYPTKWRDYSALQVDAGDLVGNAERAGEFRWNYQVGRMDGPVDRDEWGMTPQTVNAYYNSTKNEIVFPAAILQPPFFDPTGDPAVNYGGIGGVIGHEIGHGFDDQGRKSDGDGVLRDWWTAEDAANFTARTDVLGAQYASYAPLEGHNIKPGLTMGENIGDLAGITLGLEGYRRSLGGQASPVLDGVSGDQRVFYGWAQVWQSKYREDAMKNLIATDPHSPPEYRVIGPVRNLDAWYEAFGVKEGDAYYLAPAERVRLW